MDIKDRGTYEVLTEADIQDRLINYFSKWFHVDFEITSDCRKRRIDIMMFHHTDNDKLYPMGIELKKTNVKRGGDIAKWCNQASDYTKLTFKGCNPLVFIYPQISGFYLDEGSMVHKHDVDLSGSAGAHNNVNSFLYQSFGFGELQKYRHDNNQFARLTINTYIIWDSRQPMFINHEKIKMCR